MDSIKSPEFRERSKNASPYFRMMSLIFNYILYDFAGGKKHLKVSSVVSSVCLGLMPVTLFLKHHFAVDTYQSWWTTALYFSYLFVWPSKGFFFPDESWEAKLTNMSALIFAGFNLSELCSGFYFVSGYHPYAYPLSDMQWLSLCTVLYVLGVLIFTISDAQKHFILKYQKQRSLFTDGFFKYVRNPNYLGQTMVYSSFALMAYDWIPALIYAVIFVCIFWTNMKIKEASMSRYPNWSEYKKSTGFFFPKFW